MRAMIATCFLAAACTASAAPSAAPSDEVTAATAARAIAERAVVAYGGNERIAALKSTRIDLATDFAPLAQNIEADVIEDGLPVTQALLVDHGAGRIRFEGQSRFHGGYSFRFRTVIDAAGAETENLSRMGPGAFVNAVPPGDVAATRTGLEWLLPHVIAREVASRAMQARARGAVMRDGVRYELVDYARLNGSDVQLYFDAETGRLARYEQVVADPVLGDTIAEFTFVGDREVAGVHVPIERTQRVGGVRVRRDRYAVAFDAPLGEADFRHAEVPETPPAPALPPNGWVPLGKGVFLASNMQGYNALVVEFADHAVVVEAPIGSAVSRLVLDRVQKELGKPVRRLVLTHHHADHAGGVREYVASGITVTTTRGNRGYFERLLAARQNLRPDAQQRAPKAAELDFVEDKRVLADATQRLELVPVGSNSHADEMLVAWLPQAGVMFQGDLLILPDRGVSAPIEVNRELAALIEKNGWTVKGIAGAHGRVGTMADLAATLAAKAAGAP